MLDAARTVCAKDAVAVAFDRNRDRARDDAGCRADRIGNVTEIRKHHLPAEPARDFSIVNLDRAAHRHNRERRRNRNRVKPARGSPRHTASTRSVSRRSAPKCAVEHRARRKSYGFVPHILREVARPLGRRRLHIAKPRTELGAKQRGLRRPIILETQHMRRVGWREAAELDEALAPQGCQAALRTR